MKTKKNEKAQPDQANHGVITPEPPQVMNPTEHGKKNQDADKKSKEKKEATKKRG